jgi:hypothetical protein
VRVCFLVLVHNNVQHFERLISALSAPETGIFLHIDKKADARPFEEIAARYGCTIAENRVQINWGGWTMVQATLNLMKCALNSGQEYDYFCLISGGDYPLRPVSGLLEFFSVDPRIDYIRSVPMTDADKSKPISRITKFRFEVPNPVRRSHIHQRVKRKLNLWIEALPIARDYEKALKVHPCAGSQWWALTHSTVRSIMNFVDDHPSFTGFFRNTFVPDESFFQTVLERVDLGTPRRLHLTYTDWSRPTPPYPAIIDASHLEMLVENGSVVTDASGSRAVLFARKFPNDSAALVKQVQRTLWTCPIPAISTEAKGNDGSDLAGKEFGAMDFGGQDQMLGGR